MPCVLQQQKVAANIAKGPHAVTCARLFAHLAFFFYQADGLPPDIPRLNVSDAAKADTQDAGPSAEYLEKTIEHWLSWQLDLQNCHSIQQELHWCVQRRLVAEVNAAIPSALAAITMSMHAFRSELLVFKIYSPDIAMLTYISDATLLMLS